MLGTSEFTLFLVMHTKAGRVVIKSIDAGVGRPHLTPGFPAILDALLAAASVSKLWIIVTL